MHLLMLGTGVLLGWLLILGLRLQLGAAHQRRDIHHVLFTVIAALLWVLVLLSLLRRSNPLPLIVVAALMLCMPLTRPGRPAHWRLALVISLLYSVAVWWSW